MRKILYRLGFTFLIGLPLLGLIYQLPPVKDRLAWRVDELQAKIKYALAPPEQAIFVPQQQEEKNELPLPQVSTSTPVPSPTLVPVRRTAVLQPTLTSTVTATPLPDQVHLSGIRHEYQGWNNCGPATLAMALSYWDWQGDQYDIAPITKPNPRDKNVMPYELANYVETQTELKVVVRAGGDLEMIKQLVAAGFPVMVEKGFEGPNVDDWMGHYVLVTGYDDRLASFTTQDSYNGPDLPFPYDQMESYWRAFNFTYLVVYPEDRQSDVQAILGPHVDDAYSYQTAAEKASDEIISLSGRDQYFAWFNRGTNLVASQDYASAAETFDQAFAIYPTIPEEQRPWRMMWYQTGPYRAYFYTGRYQDVVDLASSTLDNMSEPVLEESYYWRALAREAMGDLDGAIRDLQASLDVHPGFEPGLSQLERLGVIE
jgi:hypothetical protein